MSESNSTWLLKAYKERLELATGYEKKLRCIVDAGHRIAGSKDITEIMEAMLELAAKISGSQFACAALMGKNNEVFCSSNTPSKECGKFPIDTGFSRAFGISGLLMRTKKHHICNITEGDSYLSEEVREEYNIKNYICVPILAKNMNFLGLLEAYNKNLFEPYDDNDADLLNTLASFTATAVERFKIYVEVDKFGSEVEAVINETLAAETAFKKECEKFESTMRENEALKQQLKKIRDLAREIPGSKDGKNTMQEKTALLLDMIAGENS